MTFALRPIEQVVTRSLDQGVELGDLATSLRKQPGTVRRIAEMAQLAQTLGIDRDFARSTDAAGLRPIERTIQRLRSEGRSVGEVAARVRRSGDYVRRVEGFVAFKQDRHATG